MKSVEDLKFEKFITALTEAEKSLKSNKLIDSSVVSSSTLDNCLKQIFIELIEQENKFSSKLFDSSNEKMNFFKKNLNKILLYLIKNNQLIYKLKLGETIRLEKNSTHNYTLFITRNPSGEFRLIVNLKTKIINFKLGGAAKTVKKTLVLMQDKWEIRAGLTTESQYDTSILFKKEFLQEKKNTNFDPSIIVNREKISNKYFIIFLDRKCQYDKIELEKYQHKNLLSEIYLLEKLKDETIEIYNPQFRLEVFDLIRKSKNCHGHYYRNYLQAKKSETKREIDIIQEINSPYIAKLQEIYIYENKKQRKLKQAYDAKLAYCDLRTLIEKHINQIDLIDIFSIMYSSFKGLADIHAAKIIHQDIKPENILIDHNPDEHFYTLITDFGLSILEAEKESHIVTGTAGYLSPEALQGVYTFKEDKNQAKKTIYTHHFLEHYDLQKDTTDVILKNRIEGTVIPSTKNDIWAMAVSMKEFLRAVHVQTNEHELCLMLDDTKPEKGKFYIRKKEDCLEYIVLHEKAMKGKITQKELKQDIPEPFSIDKLKPFLIEILGIASKKGDVADDIAELFHDMQTIINASRDLRASADQVVSLLIKKIKENKMDTVLKAPTDEIKSEKIKKAKSMAKKTTIPDASPSSLAKFFKPTEDRREIIDKPKTQSIEKLNPLS